MTPPSHPAAELVELGQAEALGIFNEHDGRIRHIHADFHDSGGYEHIRVPAEEFFHHIIFLLGFHLPVEHSNPAAREGFPERGRFVMDIGGFKPLGCFDHRTDHVCLPAFSIK